MNHLTFNKKAHSAQILIQLKQKLNVMKIYSYVKVQILISNSV